MQRRHWRSTSMKYLEDRFVLTSIEGKHAKLFFLESKVDQSGELRERFENCKPSETLTKRNICLYIHFFFSAKTGTLVLYWSVPHNVPKLT